MLLPNSLPIRLLGHLAPFCLYLGSTPKSVAAAIKKEELRRSQPKPPHVLLAELTQEFSLSKAAVDTLASEQCYLLKGREAIKVIKILEPLSANGKVDYQILGDGEAKPYASTVEGLTESLYGPIAQSNVPSLLNRVKESSQTQEAPASSQS